MSRKSTEMCLELTKHISIAVGDLYELVRHGRLPEIDAYLQKHPRACYMFALPAKLHDQSVSLLMLATLNGHDEVVRLMLSCHLVNKKCIEQEGCVYNSKGHLTTNVTALWCALDRGYFHIAHILIHMGGADPNHGPKGSLLIDATMRGRFDIVHYLVENGFTDVNRAVSNDNYKVSSLIICAARNDTRIGDYLIARGANVDCRTELRGVTPLHAAARYGRIEFVRLLVLAGATSNVRTASGSMPLTWAAINGHMNVVQFLLECDHDSATIDNLELFASSIILSGNGDVRQRAEQMLCLLRLSIEARLRYGTLKNVSEPIVAYDLRQECQSVYELDQIQQDDDRLYVEALLIQERILRPRKSDKLFPALLSRARILVERDQFLLSFNLMFHTFHLYQEMGLKTSLRHFIWLFCRMLTANVPIPADRFLHTCRLVFEPSQRTNDENSMRNAVCLVSLAAKVLEQPTVSVQDRHSIIRWIKDLCREQRRTEDGRTLLHLTVSYQTSYSPDYPVMNTEEVIIFPNLAATRLLVCHGRYWIDLDAVDQVHSNTALHLIAQSWMMIDNQDQKAIIELLINAGAHIDCVNARGLRPVDVATDEQIISTLRSKLNIPRLKCLCARAITDQQITYEHLWPTSTPIHTFIHQHGGHKRKRSSSDVDIYPYDFFAHFSLEM